MDPLRQIAFDAFLETKSGDPALDGLNKNFGAHVKMILNGYEADKAKIDAKSKLLTPAGRQVEFDAARAKVVSELNELATHDFTSDIKEINKKFDVDGNATDIQTLIAEGRQREAREYLRTLNVKQNLEEMELIKLKIAEGDPTIVGALQNAPYPVMDVDPVLLEVGLEKMRLRTNPSAAQRLAVLTQAQDTHENLILFTQQEVGVEPDTEMKVAS